MIDIAYRVMKNYLVYSQWYTIIDYWGIGHDVDLREPILTEAEPRSILVFSGWHHIKSNASIVNNVFII